MSILPNTITFLRAMSTQSFITRTVHKKLLSVEQSEGMGARVRRSIGRPELKSYDPFLMLDEFIMPHTDIGGFPDHPHRGFETVTYILPSSKGSFQHEDFTGTAGTIGPGDLQWMTAGRGIVHSEMPLPGSGGAHGLQLWVNLRSKDKMCEPQYQELKSNDVPIVSKDGVTARVIAGSALGATSKVYTRQPVHYIHFEMSPHSTLHQPIESSWNSFVYTINGTAVYGDTKSTAHHTLALSHDSQDGKHTHGLTVTTGDESAEFVLISGQPTGESAVQHGPFVMNTREQIQQTFVDYQYGKNGFEKAPGWHSKIGERLLGSHDDL